MAVELGDYNIFGRDAKVVTRESDGTGSAGDAVKLNGSGQVTPVTATGDNMFGVLAEDSPSSGEDVAVVTRGDVMVNAGGSITAGDSVEIDGTTNGRLAQNTTGVEKAVDEGGTETYTLSFIGQAHTDSGGTLPTGESLGTNEAVVDLY